MSGFVRLMEDTVLDPRLRGKHRHKAVLLHLALRYRKDEPEKEISVADLASEVGISREQCWRDIKDLREWGLIEAGGRPLLVRLPALEVWDRLRERGVTPEGAREASRGRDLRERGVTQHVSGASRQREPAVTPRARVPFASESDVQTTGATPPCADPPLAGSVAGGPAGPRSKARGDGQLSLTEGLDLPPERKREGERERKPDPLWDALVEVVGTSPATRSECSDWGRTVKEIRAVGGTPDGIRFRAKEFRRRYGPHIDLTHRVFRNAWAFLGTKSPRARGGLTPEEIRAMKYDSPLVAFSGEDDEDGGLFGMRFPAADDDNVIDGDYTEEDDE
jgi:HTH domain